MRKGREKARALCKNSLVLLSDYYSVCLIAFKNAQWGEKNAKSFNKLKAGLFNLLQVFEKVLLRARCSERHGLCR